MTSKAMAELAVIIKTGGKVKPADDPTNKSGFAGFYIGVIEVAPPEIQVRLGPEVILYKENLIISAAVLKDYEREFEIMEGEEIIIAGSIPNAFTAKGKIKWTDELKTGDKVILVPAQNDNMYILIEKAVEL
ncbi:MAG: DUF2577 family protein [Psychrobacillus psychrodurans]